MEFEWDERKNKRNLLTHGVDFAVAREVFDDPSLLVEVSRVSYSEDRWQAIGKIASLVVILVAHTYRYDNGTAVIRMISARAASRKERKRYEEETL